MHGGVSCIVLWSVLGSVLIVAGLYLVLWGKVKEEPDVHPDEEVGKESVPAADTGEKETKWQGYARIELFMKMKQSGFSYCCMAIQNIYMGNYMMENSF